MFAIEFAAMGCQMQALAQPLTNRQNAIQQALADVPVKFKVAEQRFSRFLANSELMLLNQQRNRQVSEALWDMVRHSLASAKLTHGLVSPTILPKLLERGYGDSFNTINHGLKPIDSDPLLPTNSAKIALQQWHSIELQESDRRITLHDEAMLDLGGFAKGLTALNVATQTSKAGGDVLIDAGGDIVTVVSTDFNQSSMINFADWEVALPSAQEVDLPLTDITSTQQLELPKNWQKISQPIDIGLPQKSMMLATSGIDYRHWYQNGKLQTHLVNLKDDKLSNVICASVLVDLDEFNAAKNLHPAITDFMQISNGCNLAQTLSKLCCLLGVEASLDWLNQYQLQTLGLSLIVATPTGFEQWINPAMQQYVIDDSTYL